MAMTVKCLTRGCNWEASSASNLAQLDFMYDHGPKEGHDAARMVIEAERGVIPRSLRIKADPDGAKHIRDRQPRVSPYEVAPPLYRGEPNILLGPDNKPVLRNPVGKPIEISIITLTEMLNEAYRLGEEKQNG